MPAFAVFENETATYKDGDKAAVYIAGALQPLMECTVIEHATGVTPSRALLRLGGNGLAIAGPITLNRYEWPWGPGTQVVIKTPDGNVRFRGMLIRRHDQGQKDEIVWEAWCDKWLLMQIPLRGCLVRDPASGVIKYCTRYTPRLNPKGFWNCTGALLDGNLVPVFTAVAEMGKVYESPIETFSETLQDGVLSAWTPRRFLAYLQTYSNITAGTVQGTSPTTWRSLATSLRLEWDSAAAALVGKDAGEDFDPLDKKTPDTDFRGMRMLGAIVKTLDLAGTHGLKLDYTDEISRVEFYPRGISGSLANNVDGDVTLRLKRGGANDDLNTIYDFDLDEDASKPAEAVLVDGAPVHVETPVDTVDLTLREVWTDDEDECCCTLVAGQLSGSTLYAYYPREQGSTENNALADGTVDSASGLQKPFAVAKQAEAVALARELFPHWRKAYALSSASLKSLGITEGLLAEYADEDLYPVLGLEGRPALPEQLQYYVNQSQRLPSKYPIRVQVKNELGEWRDAPGAKVRMTENGWIWIDGITEEADGLDYCIYSGKLTGPGADPLSTASRDVRLNLAFPLDHRVQGYAVVDIGDSVFDPEIFTELGGPPLMYVDSPDAYREEHQIDSMPTPYLSHIEESNSTGDTVNTAVGMLNRYLPPGSEEIHAQYAAERRLFAVRWIPKQSSWSFVGIRPDYRLGQWVGKVQVVGGNALDRDYKINAPIEHMVDDFTHQTTIVGGLIALAPAGNIPVAARAKGQGGPIGADGSALKMDKYNRPEDFLPQTPLNLGDTAHGSEFDAAYAESAASSMTPAPATPALPPAPNIPALRQPDKKLEQGTAMPSKPRPKPEVWDKDF